MKKTQKLNKNQATKKSRTWIWVVVAYILGCGVGYATHYLVTTWHSFFVVCPDGNKPDKHGCCKGEVYTDAGDGWMVCCPDGGDNCFPPMK